MKFRTHEEFDAAKEKCRDCYIGKIYNKVILSDGNVIDPTVMIIGEAPGSDEIIEGRPFVGKAGKLLRSTLNDFGFRKNNSLISNVIPCRPENNQFPKDDELVKDCFNNWLKNEIILTCPKYILLVGSQPLKFILNLKGITKFRGQWCLFCSGDQSITVMPTYHPSYVLRKMYMEEGKEIMSHFREDIKTVATKAGFKL